MLKCYCFKIKIEARTDRITGSSDRVEYSKTKQGFDLIGNVSLLSSKWKIIRQRNTANFKNMNLGYESKGCKSKKLVCTIVTILRWDTNIKITYILRKAFHQTTI